jgi:hypothetical protein
MLSFCRVACNCVSWNPRIQHDLVTCVVFGLAGCTKRVNPLPEGMTASCWLMRIRAPGSTLFSPILARSSSSCQWLHNFVLACTLVVLGYTCVTCMSNMDVITPCLSIVGPCCTCCIVNVILSFSADDGFDQWGIRLICLPCITASHEQYVSSLRWSA